MTIVKLLLTSCIIHITIIPIVWAQISPPDSMPERVPTLLLDNISSGTIDRSVATPGTTIQISSTTDSSTVGIRLNGKLSHSAVPYGVDGKRSTGIYDAWSIAATGPLKKSEDFSDIATLDGFANSFALRFQLSRFIAPGKINSISVETIKNPQSKFNLLRNELVEECQRRGGCQDEKEKAAILDEAPLYFSRWLPNRQKAYDELFWDPSASAYVFGFLASVGYEEFKFLDSGTFQESDDKKIPWSIGGFVSWIPRGELFLLTTRFEYQNAFKANSMKTICGSPNTSGIQECQTDIVGGPKDKDKILLSLEARTQIPNVLLGRPIGISLQITHDFENKDTGVDLPIYIVANESGGLNGVFDLGIEMMEILS